MSVQPLKVSQPWKQFQGRNIRDKSVALQLIFQVDTQIEGDALRLVSLKELLQPFQK